MATFGVPFTVVQKCWNYIFDSPDNIKPIHLLWTFYFVKIYPSENFGVNLIKCSEKTFRKWVWIVLIALDVYLPNVSTDFITQFPWEYRKVMQTGVISGIVDVTRIRIPEPSTAPAYEFYSAKDKFHALKYEIVVSVGKNQQIVWVRGPCKGAVNDMKIFKTGLKAMLEPGEKLLADLCYVGKEEEDRLITGAKADCGRFITDEELKHIARMNSLRQDIERVNSRLKVFNMNTKVWRHSHEKHEVALKVLCRIMKLYYEDSPLTR